MIAGIGVDLVTISRIEGVYQRHGERFAKRILAPEELQQLTEQKNPEGFLAKRFAIKEAAVKALGTGERGGVLLKDFYLEHDELGKPILRIDGKAKLVADQQGINSMHVSLSDEGNQVVAFVVFERN